jgi:hypothetical protein
LGPKLNVGHAQLDVEALATAKSSNESAKICHIKPELKNVELISAL